jgi:hypothetical protein
MPRCCSCAAALISPTRVPTWRTVVTDSCRVPSATPVRRPPSCTLAAESSISARTSRAAVDVRPASACAPRRPPPRSRGRLAGAGRLDGGIERQDVGLEGDAIDHADDVGDAVRTPCLMARPCAASPSPADRTELPRAATLGGLLR